MAAFTTILAGAALGLGAASAVSSNIAAKKARNQQQDQFDQQQSQAKEAAALNRTKQNTGADLIFGTNKASDDILRRGARRKSTNKTASDKGAVGGL